MKAPLPPESPLPIAELSPAGRQSVAGLRRGSDALELDYFVTESIIGERNQRPGYLCLALAVDATTGIILAIEVADRSTPGRSSWQQRC